MSDERTTAWDETVDYNLARATQCIRRAILAIQQVGGIPAAEFDQALRIVVSLRERHLEATGRD